MCLANAKLSNGQPDRRGRDGVAAARLPCALLTVFAVLAADIAQAQDVFFYPSKGQSQAQQEQDRFSCHQWAVQQTGFDPTRPPPAAAAPPPPPPPSQPAGRPVARGAARGAAVGAVGGAIGGDAGKGAAIGAATGAMVGGFRRRDQRMEQERQQQAYQQQAAAAQAQQSSASQTSSNSYNRALAACMQGRGYAAN